MASSVIPAASRIPFAVFEAVGLQIGTVTAAAPRLDAPKPAYSVTVDFGPRGTLTTSAQLPRNYPDFAALVGRTVIGITNLPERRMGKFKSQFLLVGFPDTEGHVQLLNTRGKTFDVGSYLYPSREAKRSIDYDFFKKSAIHNATVLSVEVLSTTSYELTLDVGLLGTQKTIVVDISEREAKDLEGTQVAVLLNLQKECMHDLDSMVLSFRTEDGHGHILGVDGPGASQVPNGGELF